MFRILLIISFGLIFTACLDRQVDGIIISETLINNRSFSENKHLKNIIKRCLNQEPKAFQDLLNFNCGDGEGCYDLGYVLTQIIFKIGEDNYIKCISELSTEEQTNLSSFIRVGLEYGDNNHDGKMDNLRIKQTFPKISELTNQ